MFTKYIFLLLLLIGLPFFANAQISNKLDIQIKTGTALPQTATHFEEYWSPGIHFGGGLEYALSDAFIIKWDAGFNIFVFNHSGWKKDLAKEIIKAGEDPGDLIVNGGNRYTLETSFGVKSYLAKTEHFMPFFTFGVGLINMSTDDLVVGLSGPEFTTETVPFLNAGLGTKISYREGFSFFGQVIYKHALTRDENSLDVSIDFKESFEQQETSMVAIEFGILFDLAKK